MKWTNEEILACVRPWNPENLEDGGDRECPACDGESLNPAQIAAEDYECPACQDTGTVNAYHLLPIEEQI